MSSFIESIDYYEHILTVLFLVVGSVISQETAGVRGGCPTPFFSYLVSVCSKETHLRLTRGSKSKLCRSGSLQSVLGYVSAVCPVIVVLKPNLQDMLTIAQGTCTLHSVPLAGLFLLFCCFNVGIMKIMKIIYAHLFICQGVFQGQIGFRECKCLFLEPLFTTLKYI